nr:RnfABCDGE type electron transport complex subunit B [Pantoea sp. Mhis]
MELSLLFNIVLKYMGYNQEKSSLLNHIACISEEYCIGCTKCSKICPTKAIIGAKHTIHTVLKDFCIGCGLCISSCPTNCINLLENNSSRFNQ